MFGAAKRDKGFKDYCLILQVHPEADGAMIDAAYWHLARRYNEASSYDSNAKSKLEELNEAYIVLGSAEKREEYMKIRTRVLGEGALPQAPGPAPATPPLTVMARQRPQERTEVAVQGKGAHLPVKQILLGAIVFLGLLGVALAATTSPIVALAAIGLGAVAILAVAAVVAALPTLGRRPSVSTSTRSAATRKRVQDAKPLEKMKAQARQVREVPVQPVPAIAPLAPPVDADLDHAEPAHQGAASAEELATPAKVDGQPDVQDEGVIESEPGDREPFIPIRPTVVTEATAQDVDDTPEAMPQPGEPPRMGDGQFAQIRRHAAEYRRIAAMEPNTREGVAEGGSAPNDDPEQRAKIMRQTERLKAIAAKFNAAKATMGSEPQDEDQAV